MLGMDQEGWKPDLVVAHPSWGEALFVRDLWPRAKLLCYLEFYYAAEGRDVGFDLEFGHPRSTTSNPFIHTTHVRALALDGNQVFGDYAVIYGAQVMRDSLQSTALTFGRFDVVAVMLCYAAAFALLAMVGAMVGLGLAWYLGLLVACVLAAYHYTLIRGRERAPCFKAFRHNNWVGGVIFAGLVVDLLAR